ncbi:MAG TPA: hypothetical protein PLU37_10720 [Chitinophagaceae bacterium]|nr:hypothetical protein [Chitinophagaceae bacterium]HPG11996.1 hypothetical protein [Chitinophagaceae bacterium]HRX92850.1 hypothetical protein [Chitinophagaceae bacterium]
MKLAPLLAEFLYSQKELSLPGIGIFKYSPSAEILESGSHKSQKNTPAGTINFENANITEAPDLVSYISSQTGKLKALAAADLNSHLELMQQFLNIGKPFLLEGIGSLVKIKSGEYAFTSGNEIPETLKDYSVKEISSTSSSKPTFSDYRKPINKLSSRSKWGKPVIALLVLAGIGLAVWGGYTVYKMTTSEQEKPASVVKNKPVDSNKNKEAVVKKDSTTTVQPNIENIQPVATVNTAGKMKYVLENANARRAFERFAKLKAYFWPVQMETKDSISYTLFMELPSAYSDTTRIIDSLTILNGKKVSVLK